LHQLAKRVKPHKNVTEILQHNNALSHTTLKTQEAITKLGQLFIPTHHTAHTPLDFHLFEAPKDAICGKRSGVMMR
jgi:hypothetical protein